MPPTLRTIGISPRVATALPTEPPTLARPRRVVHPDGARTEVLDLIGPAQPAIALDVDCSVVSELEIVISARAPLAFLLLGGSTAALVRGGALARSEPLRRDPALSNFWLTTTVAVGERLLVVHETELLLVDSELTIVWRAGKHIDDLVRDVTTEGVRIENEHVGATWLPFDQS